MLTLLAMIGLFLLVLGLVIVLLMGMFFSSDMGGIFVNVFNYATSTGIADLVTVGVMLIILFAAFAVQAVIWFFVTERMLDSALPLIVQMIIGIGAGGGVDGQVLVMHDMLGINKDFSSRFLRSSSWLGAWSIVGLVSYVFLSSHCRPCTNWVRTCTSNLRRSRKTRTRRLIDTSPEKPFSQWTECLRFG